MGKFKSIVLGMLCVNLIAGIQAVEAKEDKNIEACYSYGEAQEYQKSIASGKKDVKSSPKNYLSHLCLGVTYNKVGQFKLAIPELEKAETLTSDKSALASVANNLGEALEKTGNIDSAFKQYSKSLSLAAI